MNYKPKYPDKYDVKLAGKIVYFTGAAKLYYAGSSGEYGFVYPIFRKWHPVSWLIVLIALIPCAIVGAKISEAVPFTMSDFYKKNLKWVGWRDFK